MDRTIDRRRLIFGASVAAAGCATHTLPAAAQTACAPEAGATFLIVHGAWVGSYVFADLDRRLAARGHRVYRPSLSGFGERAHLARPEMNIDTNIDDICAVIEMEGLSGFVLVGHSYGGMVITGVADRMPERIGSIVYLDAFLPEDGKSIADYVGDDWRAACEAVLARGEFLLPMPEAFRAGLDVAKLTPVPVNLQLQRLALTGAHRRVPKKTYVHATLQPPPYFVAFYERVRNDPAWTAYTVPTGHGVYAEAPERIVEILEAARPG